MSMCVVCSCGCVHMEEGQMGEGVFGGCVGSCSCICGRGEEGGRESCGVKEENTWCKPLYFGVCGCEGAVWPQPEGKGGIQKMAVPFQT